MTKRPTAFLAFNACALFAGSAGIARFAGAAADALLAGPLAGRVRLFAPSCRRGWMPARLEAATTYFPAPDPRRGTAFNSLFWSNLLSLHLRARHRGAVFYSPAEVHALIPFHRPILTVHDCYSDHFGDPRRPGRISLGRRLQLAQMRRSRLLAVSAFTTGELAQLHGLTPPQVETVPNWLPRNFDIQPPAARLEALRARLGLPSRFWLYVGGFRLNKNLPFLIDAYAAARARHPLPPLVIAGQAPQADTPYSGPFHAVLERHAAMRDAFILPGFIPDEDLPALYKLAAMAICPSYYEGFGYPAIEAAAVGTPVIAARVASYPELVSDTDCLFSPDDPAELMALMHRAACDERVFASALPAKFLAPAGEARFNAAVMRSFARQET